MAVISCRNLTKRFGDTVALDHIDLDFEKGKIIGLLGPNGAGKTTLIRTANGLLTPTEGEIRISDRLQGVYTKQLCAYLPDGDFLPDYMKTDALLQLYQDFFADFDIILTAVFYLVERYLLEKHYNLR